MPDTIEYTVSLVMRLVDATTGKVIEDKARFTIDGAEVKPLTKPGGYHVFLNELPQERTLEARAAGFLPRLCTLGADTLPRAPDVLALELIPDVKNKDPAVCLTLEGRLSGLEELDAVKLNESTCLFREFDAKKKILTLFNPHRLSLERPRYAVVNGDEQTYETFSIIERISDTAFKINDTLNGAYSEHSHVAPVIYGSAYKGGEYLLRVRDMYTDKRFIARCRIKGGDSFRVIDFDAPETLKSAPPERKNRR